MPACALLFISGAAFYLLGVAPTMIKFFVFFDTGIDSLATQITLQDYINFMIIMTMVFGLCFQLPIAIIALNRIGIISLEQLKKARKCQECITKFGEMLKVQNIDGNEQIPLSKHRAQLGATRSAP